MFDIPLVVLLLVAGFCVGFLNAADRLAGGGSRLEPLVHLLENFRVPVGLSALVISFLNAINVWANDYAFLSWLFVMVNSIVVLKEYLTAKIGIAEGPFLSALEFLETRSDLVGIACLVVLLLKLILLLAPAISYLI